jgi:hypothetical protein
MGRAITTGQMIDMTRPCYTEPSSTATLSDYITEKVNLLAEFCIYVTEEIFNGCRSEIAVDNRTRDMILSR